MGWRVGVVLVIVQGVGCGGASTASDARADAARCDDLDDCPLVASDPLECVWGVCRPVCRNVEGGISCYAGSGSVWPPACCTPDEQCCWVGSETQACRPASKPCPFLCPRSGSWFCPDGNRCLIEYVPELHDLPPEGICEGLAPVQCSSSCPSDSICGQHECCGDYTRCDNGRCVSAPPDAGLSDAGTDDAGAADAGTVDAGT